MDEGHRMAWHIRVLDEVYFFIFFLCILVVYGYGVLLQTCALNDKLLIEPEQKKLGEVQLVNPIIVIS